MTTPDWLARRGGELRSGPLGAPWYVYFENEPQYAVTPVPVSGKHGCRVTQTINGRCIYAGGTNGTEAEAIQIGLEEVRKALGW
jgi:hypothetical protein